MKRHGINSTRVYPQSKVEDKQLLHSLFDNKFNYLNIRDSDNGLIISVPNNSRSVELSLTDDGLFRVKSRCADCTFKDTTSTCNEIVLDLVTRQLFDSGFSNVMLNSINKAFIR
jgi:hypothetical protein